MNIYVGNLPWSIDDSGLEQVFAEHGTVTSARVVTDRQTNRSRGFGFVEMAQADADNAIAKLNDSEFQQRTLKVREAKQKQEDDSNTLRTQADQSV